MSTADPVALRPCTLEDAGALALVAAATFLEAFAGILPGPAILQHCARHHTPGAYAKYLATAGVHAWLAVMRHGDAPVGYSMLTPPDLPLPDLAPGDLELKRIYLFSKFQGSGTGQQLMDVAIESGPEHAISAPPSWRVRRQLPRHTLLSAQRLRAGGRPIFHRRQSRVRRSHPRPGSLACLGQSEKAARRPPLLATQAGFTTVPTPG